MDSTNILWDGNKVVGAFDGTLSGVFNGVLENAQVGDRVSINSNGIFATDSLGNETFSIFANTGAINIPYYLNQGQLAIDDLNGTAINRLKITNSINSNGLSIAPLSDSEDIALTISSKGTGALTLGSVNADTKFPKLIHADAGSLRIVTANSSGSISTFRFDSITELGTIINGTWNASVINVGYGGTGRNTFGSGQILFGDGVNPIKTNSVLYWDDLKTSLGIGTSSPAGAIPNGSVSGAWIEVKSPDNATDSGILIRRLDGGTSFDL